MSAPPEPKVVDKFTIFTGYNFLTALYVFITFMIIDFLYYGLIHKDTPYGQDIVAKLIWTAILALTFTVVYNHSSTWRPEVQTKVVGKMSLRIINSVLFSLVVYALILSAIALSCYVVSVMFIYVLDGFHGLPESGTDAGVLASKVIIGGIVLEYCGRDETQEGRTGG